MSRFRHVAALAAFSIVIGALGTFAAAPANAAGIEVGVAPSPNGYVMTNTPTQVAVNQKATIYRKAGNKWMMLGKATQAKALPVTFSEPGIQTLKVKSGNKSKVIKVGIYSSYNVASYDTPTNYGGTILASVNSPRDYSVAKGAGCVLADVGVNNGRREPITVSILSTGAPAASMEVAPGAGQALVNVPVSGDVVIENSAPNYDNKDKMGVVMTCLARP